MFNFGRFGLNSLHLSRQLYSPPVRLYILFCPHNSVNDLYLFLLRYQTASTQTTRRRWKSPVLLLCINQPLTARQTKQLSVTSQVSVRSTTLSWSAHRATRAWRSPTGTLSSRKTPAPSLATGRALSVTSIST